MEARITAVTSPDLFVARKLSLEDQQIVKTYLAPYLLPKTHPYYPGGRPPRSPHLFATGTMRRRKLRARDQMTTRCAKRRARIKRQSLPARRRPRSERGSFTF